MTEAPLHSSKLDDWFNWLSLLNPSKIELGLDRVRTVHQKLPQLNSTTKVVTIAGTNGKGSCVAALQALSKAAGKRVLAYSSPHLLHFNERIQIQALPVLDDQLVEAFQAIAKVQSGIRLTYFEFTTLAALYLAANDPPDILILEVGLGGRLDAVNIIDADLVILTALGLDHTEWLGNDIDSIACEKCGVLRPNIPLVLAAPDVPEAVYQIALKNSAKIYAWGEQFEILPADSNSFCARLGDRKYWLESLYLHPQSLGAALMAFDLIWPNLTAEVVGQLASIKLAGRYQQLQIGSRRVILDVAHNTMSFGNLVENLKSRGVERVDLLFAIMADKDCESAISLLAPICRQWNLLELGISRALPSKMLAEMLSSHLVSRINLIAPESSTGWHELFAMKYAQIPLLVTGSFYTVAAFLHQPEIESLMALNTGKIRG